MKTINTYINEKLRLTTKQKYTCQPNSKDELRKIIEQRIKDEGNECDLNDIDTSKIIDMSHLFEHLFDAANYKILKDFNGDISQWDVSNVKYMYGMFWGCEKFNCDLSKWNVSNVKDMRFMFRQCYEFDCDISAWDVSNVIYINNIFSECKKFNQNLNSWDVSNVKYMTSAFKNCPTTPTWYDRKQYDK